MVRAGGRGKSKVSYNYDEESGDEVGAEPDSEEEFSDGGPPPAKKKAAPKKAAKGKKRGGPKSKVAKDLDTEEGDNDVEEEDEEEAPAKGKKRGGPKSKVAKDLDTEEGDNDVEEEDEEEAPPPPKKRGRAEPEEPEDAIEIPDDEEEVLPSKKSKKATPGKVVHKDDADEDFKATPGKVVYKDDTDEDFTDAGEVDGEDSDFEEKKKSSKKRTPAKKKSQKKTPAKAKKGAKKKTPASASRASGRSAGAAKPIKYAYSSESELSEQESEFDDDESAEDIPLKQRKVAKQSAKTEKKKVDIPPVSKMVTTAITRLRDNPRKGSSLSAIKGFMAEEWGLTIPDYAAKIKKFLLNAVESEEIKQTKGKGASGRFTLPGLKVKKRKRAPKLGEKWDEDSEPEYEPKKRARDEDREKNEQEVEMRRLQRMEETARKEEEKANRPKKEWKKKKTEWAVEMIKGMKVREDKTWYLVKWEGSSKTTWEPEENLTGCQDIIDNFLIEEKTRLREEEMRRKREEEEGAFEVGRIIEVKFCKSKGKENNAEELREFLIRWKGHGEDDDSWEPEENLACPEMIEKFMAKHEKRLEASEKTLRAAPKAVARLNYASSARVGRKNQGFRMTYEGMDE